MRTIRILLTVLVVAGCTATPGAPAAERAAREAPTNATIAPTASGVGVVDGPAAPTDPHLRCSDPSLWVCVE